MIEEAEITRADTNSAKNLIETAFKELREGAKREAGEEVRYFFPNGIDLISITVTVAKITVEFKIAGAACCKGIEEGFTFEEAQDITEEQ